MPDTIKQTGTYCQSCGMPISDAALFGTETDGRRSTDYCTYCFRDGAFTADVSREEFTEMQVKIAVKKLGVDESTAREMANTVLPTLKRWKV